MGSTNRRARPKMKQNLERVYDMFPRLQGAPHSKGWHLERGRTANAGSRTRHHVRSGCTDGG